jgi:hypothetical protein
MTERAPETKKGSPMNFRPDSDLRDLIDQWLELNPGFENRSQVINMAVKQFISQPQTLRPVTTIAIDDEFEETVDALMKKERKTLDELK